MRALDHALCAGCVALVSLGQVLLRAAALKAGASSASLPAKWLSPTTLAALVVYGGAMLLWLWVLTRVPLTQAFAYFGLCFLLVPILAHLWLGDPVNRFTWLGAALILAGIVVTHLEPR